MHYPSTDGYGRMFMHWSLGINNGDGTRTAATDQLLQYRVYV